MVNFEGVVNNRETRTKLINSAMPDVDGWDLVPSLAPIMCSSLKVCNEGSCRDLLCLLKETSMNDLQHAGGMEPTAFISFTKNNKSFQIH